MDAPGKSWFSLSVSSRPLVQEASAIRNLLGKHKLVAPSVIHSLPHPQLGLTHPITLTIEHLDDGSMWRAGLADLAISEQARSRSEAIQKLSGSLVNTFEMLEQDPARGPQTWGEAAADRLPTPTLEAALFGSGASGVGGCGASPRHLKSGRRATNPIVRKALFGLGEPVQPHASPASPTVPTELLDSYEDGSKDFRHLNAILSQVDSFPVLCAVR